MITEALDSAQRIVIKTGSALVVDTETGAIRTAWIEGLCRSIKTLFDAGKDVVLVSSGAIAVGRHVLKLPRTGLRLEEKQAAAAAGQIKLIRAMEAAFEGVGITPAQALLTIDDTERRRRWLNARATLETLMAKRAVTIINENDTVATEEIRYGDNDRLAARVAQMIGADLLILLSDIDGLYTADPRIDPNAKHIPVVDDLNDEIYALASGANKQSGVGSGGMITKLDAARIAQHAGCSTIITKGATDTPIMDLSAGAKYTLFRSTLTPRTARNVWLQGALQPNGAVRIDAGAQHALEGGASLLPIGVLKVEGPFERGDAISILTEAGDVIGKGVTAYSSEDANNIKGLQSDDIEIRLGFKGRPAIIHRDDLVLGGH